MILALAGGVGGAKLAHGLAMRVPITELLVVVNTGDDFVHLGLHISPDVDTVMYWLAGLNDVTRGWGQADESWQFMAALERLGGPTWFNLGDRDLATHVERTRRLAVGDNLSLVTDVICARLGVRHRVAPMSDLPVRTIVHTDEGALAFQDYFVRRRCEPRIARVEYAGASNAVPSAAFDQALGSEDLDAIIVCPSNPFLSVEPILSLGGVRTRIEGHHAPAVAVSPIVGGRAIKGPAAKILSELGSVPSALEVARHYAGLIDGIVIDEIDGALKPAIEEFGVHVCVANTIMKSAHDQARLADVALAFAAEIGPR